MYCKLSGEVAVQFISSPGSWSDTLSINKSCKGSNYNSDDEPWHRPFICTYILYKLLKIHLRLACLCLSSFNNMFGIESLKGMWSSPDFPSHFQLCTYSTPTPTVRPNPLDIITRGEGGGEPSSDQGSIQLKYLALARSTTRIVFIPFY